MSYLCDIYVCLCGMCKELAYRLCHSRHNEADAFACFARLMDLGPSRLEMNSHYLIYDIRYILPYIYSMTM